MWKCLWRSSAGVRMEFLSAGFIVIGDNITCGGVTCIYQSRKSCRHLDYPVYSRKLSKFQFRKDFFWYYLHHWQLAKSAYSCVYHSVIMAINILALATSSTDIMNVHVPFHECNFNLNLKTQVKKKKRCELAR